MAALVEEMVGREEDKLHSVVRYSARLRYLSKPTNHLFHREILVGLAKNYMDKVCKRHTVRVTVHFMPTFCSGHGCLVGSLPTK